LFRTAIVESPASLGDDGIKSFFPQKREKSERIAVIINPLDKGAITRRDVLLSIFELAIKEICPSDFFLLIGEAKGMNYCRKRITEIIGFHRK